MKIQLGVNAYGKNAIHLSRIVRHEDRHDFQQITVDIQLTGDFERAHAIGDNALILPTDTQKNTVYALAREHFTDAIEQFAAALAQHFLSNNPQLDSATVTIQEHPWQRIHVGDTEHATSFINSGPEKRFTRAVMQKNHLNITSGIRDLLILKATRSAFKGYLKDSFTTLKETDDRILATQCEIEWDYADTDVDFNKLYEEIRQELLETFAEHDSLSVQHTLYAMGEAVLKKFDVINEIRFKMPNKHHIPVDLSPFGMENKNDVFVATDAPYGFITGTVRRS
jgi:urate oxidase